MSRAVATGLVATEARALKMPGLARVYEALARQAREEHWDYEDYLHEVLSAEQTSRAESAVRHRLRDAHFPELKTLDTFDFTASAAPSAQRRLPSLRVANGSHVIATNNPLRRGDSYRGDSGMPKVHQVSRAPSVKDGEVER